MKTFMKLSFICLPFLGLVFVVFGYIFWFWHGVFVSCILYLLVIAGACALGHRLLLLQLSENRRIPTGFVRDAVRGLSERAKAGEIEIFLSHRSPWALMGLGSPFGDRKLIIGRSVLEFFTEVEIEALLAWPVALCSCKELSFISVRCFLAHLFLCFPAKIKATCSRLFSDHLLNVIEWMTLSFIYPVFLCVRPYRREALQLHIHEEASILSRDPILYRSAMAKFERLARNHDLGWAVPLVPFVGKSNFFEESAMNLSADVPKSVGSTTRRDFLL